jgi:outer membrane protein, heavy metal efflux system
VSRNTWVLSALVAFALAQNGFAQQAFTWTQIRDKFESSNPSLLAGQINIDESRAQEITAFLRPNPDFTAGVDQLDLFTSNPYRPLQYALPSFSTSYLHERQHKRELRLESARKGTSIARSQQDDLERTLLFSLRSAFVQALRAKAVLALARDNLAYYDRILSVSRDRLAEGDIARVDMQRLHLQRVQYESDVQTADVNLRTAKIQLLALLNDRTPVGQFDVTGPFEFSESVMPLDEFRRLALDSRPDLRAAIQSVDKARTDHRLAISNGSTDPTFGFDVAVQNPPIPVYAGFSVNIPLRIFDRNQGEKARTELDIRRNQRLQEAAAAEVYSDVDSAYAA